MFKYQGVREERRKRIELSLDHTSAAAAAAAAAIILVITK